MTPGPRLTTRAQHRGVEARLSNSKEKAYFPVDPLGSAWLGRMATKTPEDASTAATNQTVQYMAKAIAQYYGLTPGS